MQSRAFLRAVTVDRSDALDRVLVLLSEQRVRWCLVGGLAVNAYVEPVVTLDMDLVVAAEATDRFVRAAVTAGFVAQRHAHSINLSATGSDLRIQIQTDHRYDAFIESAQPRDVLGLTMPVASPVDILQGKVWAFQDPQRRASKRQKDLADISRLLEAFPALRPHVPDDVLARLI